MYPLGDDDGGFLIGAEELATGSCPALVDGAGEVEVTLGIDLEDGSVGVLGMKGAVGGWGEVG